MKTKTAKSKEYYRLVRVKPSNYKYVVGEHRYVLKFESNEPSQGKSAAIIQMNGSTTNWKNENEEDWSPDPTIGKVLCWCHENNEVILDTIYCLNMWSAVDKDPYALKGKGNDTLNNVKNDKWIAKICKNVDYVIVAHGDCKGVDSLVLKGRKEQLGRLLLGCELYHVGKLTKKGNPRHGRGWNGSPDLYPL